MQTIIYNRIILELYSVFFPGATQLILMANTTTMVTTVQKQMMVWCGTLGEDGGTL